MPTTLRPAFLYPRAVKMPISIFLSMVKRDKPNAIDFWSEECETSAEACETLRNIADLRFGRLRGHARQSEPRRNGCAPMRKGLINVSQRLASARMTRIHPQLYPLAFATARMLPFFDDCGSFSSAVFRFSKVGISRHCGSNMLPLCRGVPRVLPRSSDFGAHLFAFARSLPKFEF